MNADGTIAAARFEGRMMRAAVLHEANQALEVEELEIAEPGPREVMVRLVASGVYHSDLHIVNGEGRVTRLRQNRLVNRGATKIRGTSRGTKLSESELT